MVQTSVIVFTYIYTIATLFLAYYIPKLFHSSLRTNLGRQTRFLTYFLVGILIFVNVFYWIEKTSSISFIFKPTLLLFEGSDLIWIIIFVMQIIAFVFGIKSTSVQNVMVINNNSADDLIFDNISSQEKNVIKTDLTPTPSLKTSSPSSTPISITKPFQKQKKNDSFFDLLGIIMITLIIISIIFFFTLEQIPGIILIIMGLFKFKDIMNKEWVWLAFIIAGIIIIILVEALNINIISTSSLSATSFVGVLGLGIIQRKKTQDQYSTIHNLIQW